MKLKELIRKNRSYRRFDETVDIGQELLRELVDLARLSPSAGNKQPLKYYLSREPSINEKIFPHLAWAGFLKNWNGPASGERPTAYIIILRDTCLSASVNCDHGIVAQSMLLGAVEKGFGGCVIASIDRPGLQESLKIPAALEILLVIALGKPAEKVILEPMDKNQDIRYWRDKEDRHHVPKRKLDDLIVS